MTNPSDHTGRISLRQLIYESFDVAALVTLCVDLGIEVEEVAADQKSVMVTNLLRYVARMDEDKVFLEQFIGYCRRQRPGRRWPDPAEIDLSAATDLDWQTRQEREAIFNDLIRPERIPAYKKLWALFEPLAKYSPPGPFTYRAAWNLSNSMRHWYFEGGGGMFLSESSRATYFPVQEYLGKCLLGQGADMDDLNSPLPDEDIKTLRRLGSLLRASLAEDIGIGRRTFDAGTDPIPENGARS